MMVMRMAETGCEPVSSSHLVAVRQHDNVRYFDPSLP